MFVTPFQAFELLSCLMRDSSDLSSLKFLIVGGAVISEEKLIALRKFLPNALVLNGYGLTELQGAALLFDMNTETELALDKSPSVGKAIQGYSYKVCNKLNYSVYI